MGNMKILVLGAGGVGGYFGGRLAEAGADVTFLVREVRRARLESEGLRIKSQFGDASIPVRTVLQNDVQHEYDLVLVACKAYDLSSAIEAIAPALKPSSAILPLLNGIAHVELLNDRFGRERVLGGTAKIQATLTPDGVVHQLNDWRYITFGEQDGAMSPRVLALKAEFDSAKGVEAEAVPDILQRMWEKLVHLCTAAAMTCLMRANVGEIVRTPAGNAQFLTMLETAADIAAANGHRPSDTFMANYRNTFSERESQYATSMLRDIENGNRTEGDHIVGFMLEKAKQAGLENPTLALAHTHLKAYDERRMARPKAA
jgi:2-dehydropantoate 2-reductase